MRGVSLDDSASFRLVRATIRSRAGRPRGRDTALNIYEVLLVMAVAVIPVGRAVMIGLAAPSIPVFLSPPLVSTAAAVLTVAAFVLGRWRGPVVPSASYLDAVVAGLLPRRLTLRGSHATSRAVAVSALTVVIMTLIGARALGGDVDPIGALLVVAGSTIAWWLLSLVWLIGQISGRAHRIVGAVLVLTAPMHVVLAALPGTAAVAAWVTPWGWISVLWAALSGVKLEHIVASTLLAVCLLANLILPRLLDRLARDDIADQSRRWASARTLALTGDLRSATTRLRAWPRLGRHWRWMPAGTFAASVLLRDLVGIARFPGRAVVAALACVALGTLLIVSLTAGAAVAPVMVVGLYFSIGVWCEGLRMFGSTVGGSSPYGVPPISQAAAHLLAPLTLGFVCVGVGVIVGVDAVAGLANIDAPVAGVAWTMLLVPLAVMAQALAAVKGPLPVVLLMPIPTPMGDVSIINVALWLADSVILVMVVGGGLTGLAVTIGPTPVLFVALALGIAVTVGWSYVRLRRLERS